MLAHHGSYPSGSNDSLDADHIASPDEVEDDLNPGLNDAWPSPSNVQSDGPGIYAQNEQVSLSPPPLILLTEQAQDSSRANHHTLLSTSFPGPNRHQTSWELQALGLEEPLPSQEDIEDL